MRNPKRIKELMDILTAIWELQPDVRFNQLLHSLQYMYKNGKYVKKAYVDEVGWGTSHVFYPDLFNVEDDDFIEFLKEKYNEMKSMDKSDK